MRRLKTDAQWWHIYSRGARRLSLFHEEDDNWEFIHALRRALAVSGCLLGGYVLMSNHYHLILRGTSEQLTRCVRHVNHHYSCYHNRKYALSGHAFDGPYRAHLQASPFLLLRKLAYVFLNPVTAGIASHPKDYPWSGFCSFIGTKGSPLPTSPLDLLSHLDSNPKRARMIFEKIIEEEMLRSAHRPGHVPSALEINKREFEWLLEHARKIPSICKEDSTAVAVCWGRRCGIPPKAMAGVLGLPDATSVYSLLCRCRRRAGCDPAYASLLTPP